MLFAAPATTGLVSHLRELAMDAFNSTYYCNAISLGAEIAEEATELQLSAIHVIEDSWAHFCVHHFSQDGLIRERSRLTAWLGA
jgi:hypothetical protein